MNNAFFASLGVFIIGINSSIATGLCSFFRKNAKGNLSKKQLYWLAFFQKNRAHG
jgi:hypothetical protein